MARVRDIDSFQWFTVFFYFRHVPSPEEIPYDSQKEYVQSSESTEGLCRVCWRPYYSCS